jgi:iron-sulfur cluster assembly protein
MIIVTQAASDKLKSLREGDKALRISVSGGGCSGYNRKLEWIEPSSITEHDKLLVVGDDLKIAIDGKSHIFLAGSTLDYSDDMNDGGFKWDKPGAKTCGCGASFSG